MIYKDLESLLKDYPQCPLGRANDLSGKTVNHLTFVCRVKTENNRLAYWALKCDCGNYCVARAYSVLQNNTTSCGCQQQLARINTDHSKDITNQRFGLLVAQKMVGKDKYGNTRWLCKCDCGNDTVVSANNLKSGSTSSCGKCIRKESSYELQIKNWLSEHKFQFESECKVTELGNQRFDFKVYIDKDKYIFIEMQGEQHYRPIERFGGIEKFKIQIEHDKQKQQYCQSHNISLLVIKYNENITQKLSNFLLS